MLANVNGLRTADLQAQKTKAPGEGRQWLRSGGSEVFGIHMREDGEGCIEEAFIHRPAVGFGF